MRDDMKKKAEEVGLDWDKVRKGLERMLPILSTIAALTPNQFDDLAVAFLKLLVAEKQ